MSTAGTLVDWIIAIATLGAILVAAWQLRATSLSAGQTHAREAWMTYLELGLQNPDLSNDRVALTLLKMRNLSELTSGESVNSQRYLWFRDIMLEACESLTAYFPTGKWRKTIKYNLHLHKRALKLTWEYESEFYSEELCRLVEEVLKEEDQI